MVTDPAPKIVTAAAHRPSPALAVVNKAREQFNNPKPGTFYSQGAYEAWCANFVSWVMKETGTPLRNPDSGSWRIAGVYRMMDTFKSNGTFKARGYTPKPGDVVLYGGSGHTNIVVDVNDDGTMTTIGGNESNRVSQRKLSVRDASIVGFGQTPGAPEAPAEIAETPTETPEGVMLAAGVLPPAPEAMIPAPEVLPPAPDALPPAPDALPPAPGAVPPAPEAVIPAPEGLPPAPGVLPPAPEVAPPAPEVVPPAPEILPPAPEAMIPAPEGLPPAPEALLPAPDAVIPVPEALPPAPEVLPPAPEVLPPAPEALPPAPAPEPMVFFPPAPEVVPPVMNPEPIVDQGFGIEPMSVVETPHMPGGLPGPAL